MPLSLIHIYHGDQRKCQRQDYHAGVGADQLQNTIHRVLKLIRPYTGMVILTLTFALITVVTTLLAPVLSGKAVRCV